MLDSLKTSRAWLGSTTGCRATGHGPVTREKPVEQARLYGSTVVEQDFMRSEMLRSRDSPGSTHTPPYQL